MFFLPFGLEGGLNNPAKLGRLGVDLPGKLRVSPSVKWEWMGLFFLVLNFWRRLKSTSSSLAGRPNFFLFWA